MLLSAFRFRRASAPSAVSFLAGPGRPGSHAVPPRFLIPAERCVPCCAPVFLTRKLRDEAPSAYKDIHAVMRAQREMTRIIRKLRPVLSYKGA